ncbi:MAG: PQQ-binding-like beta-propeller repeat protein [Candidatus Brocadiia bacterium]
MTRSFFRTLLQCFPGLSLALAVAHSTAALGAEVEQLLHASGVRGGLVVHLGCGDGRLTAALGAEERYLVHGLDTDPGRVLAARRHIASRGLYGRVSADTFDGEHLPYVDELVDLVVAEDLGGVPMGEVMRALAPRGVAMIGGRKTVKPWPADIDEWTHFLHDASGNAVARDRRVGPPSGLRWTAGPKHTRDHDALASMSAMTSSGGRLFYIFDEGHTSLVHRPPKWRLVARDAFNGVLLWKRPIPTWVTHLWYFRTGPVQLPRRLVSVDDRVYVTLGLDAPVCELDAASGETLRVFRGSEGTEEILHHRDILLTVVGDPALLNDEAPKVYGYWQLSVDRRPAAGKAIVATRASTGQILWKKTGENLAYLAPLSLAACADKVFFLDSERLHCLRLDDGRELWTAPFPTQGLFLRSYAPTVVACDDVVMCMAWNRLHAFATADGRKLWEHGGAIGFASPGDLFAIDGLAWTVPTTAAIWRGSRRGRDGRIRTGIPIPRKNFLGDGGEEIWGIDLRTGEIRNALPRARLLPGGHHARCYRNKATLRYLICGRRGLEYIDLRGDGHVNNWWVRGLCQYGVMPANGLTYVPPDPCRCFNHIKVNGFLALAAASSLDGAADRARPSLERGPAFAEAAQRRPQDEPLQAGTREPAAARQQSLAWHPPLYPADPHEWPTYRGNISRSGSTRTAVPAELKELWQAELGESLTAPVAAAGRLWACSNDSHTVHCVDADTGRPLWQFAAGGRVDSPPTLYEELCVFGCRDGWVYCLRASDGALAWRFRGAPGDRRVVADSRLESVWPISGSVLVLDGVAYFAAGRSSYLDGGIRLLGLDVRSGRKLYEAIISTKPGPLGRSGPPGHGALPDVLVSDGSVIAMRHHHFDKKLKPRGRSRLRTLCASTGLLEDRWFHRQPWRLGRGRAPAVSQAKLIVFDADLAYGVMNPYTWLKHTRAMWPEDHDGHLHQKYSRYRASQFPVGVKIAATSNAADRQERRGEAGEAAPAGRWSTHEPIQPRAMVLAGDRLFLAGWRDAVAVHERTGRPLDPDQPDPRPAFLWVRSATDGAEEAAYPLDAEPVFDGLIAAYGRLFLSAQDGTVRCFGGPR